MPIGPTSNSGPPTTCQVVVAVASDFSSASGLQTAQQRSVSRFSQHLLDAPIWEEPDDSYIYIYIAGMKAAGERRPGGSPRLR
jgi:hypothetical protein